MSSQSNTQPVSFSPLSPMLDAGGRERVSQLTTLFDGKTIGGADTLGWTSAGTGVIGHDGNKTTLTVGANQWAVYQTRRLFPYFSGKSQLVEMTIDRFDTQVDVVKRMGYFSSTEASPYTTNVDGFYLEDDGVTKRFVMKRMGVTVFDRPLSEWVNGDKWSSYNWANFTVVAFDFLWLGGAIIRMYIKHPHDGFVLADVVHYAGTSEDVFMLNPSQPLRYEIRSVGQAGDMRPICSMIASEGSLNRVGQTVCEYSGLLNANTVGTVYAIRGFKGNWARKYSTIDIANFGGVVTTADSGLFIICLNPTLSAPLTYTISADGLYYNGVPTTQTVTNTGRVLDVLPINASGSSRPTVEGSLSWASFNLAGSADEFVLAYIPATTNQAVIGTLTLAEY